MDSALTTDYEKQVRAPFVDGLTGLFNHGYFTFALDHEIRRFARHGNPFTLGLVDIDWFSLFNKRFGFIEGDRMLKGVAQLVKSTIRDVDIAARYLGDVFAVVFIMSERGQARIAGERLCRAVERMSEGKITVSIGLASCSVEMTPASLILKAQEALAQAKARGKNRIYLYEEPQAVVRETSPRVLVVDDDAINRKLLETFLLSLNYQVFKATNGEEALHIVNKTAIDLILLDAIMPGMDGFEVCRRLKAHDSTRLIPVIMLTALGGQDTKLEGIEAGADDLIVKPPNRAELMARTKSLLRVKSLNDSLANVENLLVSLANAIEARDIYTQGHVKRVANLAHALGSKMGLSSKQLKALKLGGILHDIGKIHISDAILNKPGPLTPEERKTMEAHAESGYKIVFPLKKSLGEAIDVIRSHHEMLDGSGYPAGLKKDDIPVVARVMAVVDIYDSLVSDLPYRRGMSREDALEIINGMTAQGKLDPEVVRCFAASVYNDDWNCLVNRDSLSYS